jgi:hypothetical protein
MWYGQTASGPDLWAVLFWTALPFAAAVPLLYLPMMTLLRRLLHGYKPTLAFPLIGAFLGIAPTQLVDYSFSGEITFLASPETRLFYSCFAVAGVAFGLGFALWRQPSKVSSR